MSKKEPDYKFCWFQLRHRVDEEVNHMMDIIEEADLSEG